MVPQRSIVVRAQSQELNANSAYPYNYYYWLTPGRIAGIAIAAIALIFFIISMLIMACRRRRAKANSIMVSNVTGHPQSHPFPSWQGQQQGQMPYGIDAPNVGWYYPTQGAVPPFDQTKSTSSSSQAQRTATLGDAQEPGFTSQASGGSAQRPLPTSQARPPVPPTQMRSTAPAGQVPTTAPPSQVQRAQTTAAPSSQVRTAPPGRPQTTAPPTQQQRQAPLAPPQTIVPPVQTQEQAATIPPPPRPVRTKVPPRNSREPSPPPYYSPTP